MTRDGFRKAVTELQVMLGQCTTKDINLTISNEFVMVRYGSAVVSVEPNADDAATKIFGPPKNAAAPTDQLIEKIYQAYPRRRDRKAAYKAIRKAITDPEIPVAPSKRGEFVLRAVMMYAIYVDANRTDRDKIPYPATWFNRGSYLNSLESGSTTQQRAIRKGDQW